MIMEFVPFMFHVLKSLGLNLSLILVILTDSTRQIVWYVSASYNRKLLLNSYSPTQCHTQLWAELLVSSLVQ